MRKHKKHLDFEINLIPCIDLLSVCICFLLLTAVWLNIGSMNVKQAVGGQSQAETPKKPLMWVFMADDGQLTFNVQQSSLIPAALTNLKIAGLDGHANVGELSRILAQLTSKDPGLKTALIQPRAKTSYEDIIALMDEFKKLGLTDLGVAPL
ncbi:MAG: biopolymer transporter ExbD [Bdellovibrionaceae bacterium]|nr:biopolymer transporter ExbD [Pseudobdellovibrionaceae bacterium]